MDSWDRGRGGILDEPSEHGKAITDPGRSTMHIEEFALGNSAIHNLDPRVKIVAALVFSLIVALNNSVTMSAVAFCFPLALIAVARISIKKLLMRLAAVNVFIGLLWVCLPFTVPGEILYSLGPLSISREGIIAAFSLTLKSNAIILAMIALLGTSRVFTLVHALSHLGVPHKLIHLFFFCFRYIQVIHEEYHRLANAAKDAKLQTRHQFPYLQNVRLLLRRAPCQESRSVTQNYGCHEMSWL